MQSSRKYLTREQLLAKLEEQRRRLEEAEATLRAIQSGEVDAIVVTGSGREQVFTRKGADYSFRLLVEGMDEGALVLTNSGSIMYANRRFAEMVQTPLQEVIGSEINDWIAPDSQNLFQWLLGEEGESGRRVEMMFITSNDTRVPVHLSKSIHTPTDRQDFICLVATDLSEINKRKEMEEIAKSVSEYTRRLIEASLDPLVTISTGYKITDVNIATENVTGVGRDRLIGSDFTEYFTQPSEALAVLKKVFQKGYVIDYPLSFRHSSGKITSVLYNASLYHDNNGTVLGALTTARDITKRKKLEAQQVMDKLNRDKDLFLANMSHELRTPLLSILNFATLAKRRLMEGRYTESMVMLDRLLAGKERLLRFVTNMECLARIHVGMWRLHLVSCDLIPLVQEVVFAKKRHFAKKNLQWRVSGQKTVSAHFDHSSVSIILGELLDNAGLFSPQEGVVDIRVTESVGQVKIAILDSGPGIPIGEEEAIFSPFVESSLTRSDASGTGLGLSIAFGLVQLIGGTLQIANRQEVGGTAVMLVLPNDRCD